MVPAIADMDELSLTAIGGLDGVERTTSSIIPRRSSAVRKYCCHPERPELLFPRIDGNKSGEAGSSASPQDDNGNIAARPEEIRLHYALPPEPDRAGAIVERSASRLLVVPLRR